MAVNVNNSFVGTPDIDGGVFYSAPVGTPLPKTARETLDKAFKDHGAVAEDGFTVNPQRTSQDVKMFGGGTFREVQTEFVETVSITLLEDDNINVIKTSFGDEAVKEDKTKEGGISRTIFHSDKPLPIKSYVLKTVDGDKIKTYIIEQGRVSTVEKTADIHNDVTRTTLTLKVFKSISEDLKGAYVVERRSDDTFAGVATEPAGSTPTGKPAGTENTASAGTVSI